MPMAGGKPAASSLSTKAGILTSWARYGRRRSMQFPSVPNVIFGLAVVGAANIRFTGEAAVSNRPWISLDWQRSRTGPGEIRQYSLGSIKRRMKCNSLQRYECTSSLGNSRISLKKREGPVLQPLFESRSAAFSRRSALLYYSTRYDIADHQHCLILGHSDYLLLRRPCAAKVQKQRMGFELRLDESFAGFIF